MRSFTTFAAAGMAALAALATAPTAAHALSFTVNQFSSGNLASAQADFGTLKGQLSAFSVAEDFEGFDTVAQIGPDANASLTTAVGSFTTLGGTGTGSTAINTIGTTANNNGRGLNLSIRQDGDAPDNGGRVNTSDGAGDKTYLDSNDTLGFKWVAETSDKKLFDRLLFTLVDPSDQGKTLTISAKDFTQTFTILPGQSNGEIFNVLISFSSLVDSAELSLAKSGVNDGFSIDNATIGAVPLPAAAWMLLSVAGGLFVAKRRVARVA